MKIEDMYRQMPRFEFGAKKIKGLGWRHRRSILLETSAALFLVYHFIYYLACDLGSKLWSWFSECLSARETPGGQGEKGAYGGDGGVPTRHLPGRKMK